MGGSVGGPSWRAEEGEAEVPEIVIVSDVVDGTSVDLDDEGVNVPEETAELVKLVSQERVKQRTAEVQVDSVKLVSLERVQQPTAEVPVVSVSLVSLERVQQRIAEAQLTRNSLQERISERTQIVDVPVPQILVEMVSQERVQQRTAEQIEDAPQFLKDTVEMHKISYPVLLRTVVQYLDTGRESPSRFFERIRERILEQEEKETQSEEGLPS